LLTHLSQNERLQKRFEQEARAVSALNHPNICTLHDIRSHDNLHYLVMEFLSGETLRDRLRSEPLSARKCIEFGIHCKVVLLETVVEPLLSVRDKLLAKGLKSPAPELPQLKTFRQV
jgi:serine/threonine protein kinase